MKGVDPDSAQVDSIRGRQVESFLMEVLYFIRCGNVNI